MDCSLSPLPAAPAAGIDPAAGAGTATGFEGEAPATGFEACLDRLAGGPAAADAPGEGSGGILESSSVALPVPAAERDAAREEAGSVGDAGQDESAEDERNEAAVESVVVPCVPSLPVPVEWGVPQSSSSRGVVTADRLAAAVSLPDPITADAGVPASPIPAPQVAAPGSTQPDRRFLGTPSPAEGTRMPEEGSRAPVEGRSSRGEGTPSSTEGTSPVAVSAAAPRPDAAELRPETADLRESLPADRAGVFGVPGEGTPAEAVPPKAAPDASAAAPEPAAAPRGRAAHTLLVRALAGAREVEDPAGVAESAVTRPTAAQVPPSIESPTIVPTAGGSGRSVAAARTVSSPDAGDVTAAGAEGAAGEAALARWRWTAAAGRFDGGDHGFDDAGPEARSAWGRAESPTEASTDAGPRAASLDGRVSWAVTAAPEAQVSVLPTLEAGEIPAHTAEARAAFAEAAAEADLLPQVVKAVHLQWRDGVGEARLRLQPEHLGEVRVQLNIEHGRVVATIGVEGEAVGDWVSSHEQELRAALADQGLVLDRLVVDPDGGHQREADNGRARREAPRPARRAPSGARFEVRV